jgi:hypothetical protein
MASAVIPDPKTTLAIILGASEFPKSKSLASNPAFASSSKKFKEYLIDSTGFGLPTENLLDLFDTTNPPSSIDEIVTEFINERLSELRNRGTPAQDVLLYYVGHGGFTDDGRAEYFLALYNTNDAHKASSGYLMRSLAQTIKNSARYLRRYLILDCCFSAAAYEYLQGAPLDAAVQQTLENLPSKGTALLCSASRTEPSKTLPGYPYTMFSTALLQVLGEGDEHGEERLSFRELRDLVTNTIHDTFPTDAVRPEVHSPDQRQGDVDQVPFFPNPAKELGSLQARNDRLTARLHELSESLSAEKARNESLDKTLQELQAEVKALKPSILLDEAKNNSNNKYLYMHEGTVQKYFRLTDAERASLSTETRIKLMQYYRAQKIFGYWAIVLLFLTSGLLFSMFNFNSSYYPHGSDFLFLTLYLLCWILCIIVLRKLLKPFSIDLLINSPEKEIRLTDEENQVIEAHKLKPVLLQRFVFVSDSIIMRRPVYLASLIVSVLCVLTILIMSMQVYSYFSYR